MDVPIQGANPIPAAPTADPTNAALPEAAALLEQLRDIELPEPASWWPPAPGWWAVAAAALIALFFLARFLNRRRLEGLYKKEARQLLADVHAEWDGAQDVRVFASSVHQLVRRVVIHHAGRDGVAGLTGSAFIEEANRLSTAAISPQTGSLLTEIGYRSNADVASVTDVDSVADVGAIEREVAEWLGGLVRSPRA
jgi:hypothetical protein